MDLGAHYNAGLHVYSVITAFNVSVLCSATYVRLVSETCAIGSQTEVDHCLYEYRWVWCSLAEGVR